MKMSIQWHEECMANRRSYLLDCKKRLLRDIQAYRKSRQDIRFAEEQLEEAKRRKLPGYDNDRFLVKRSAHERKD